MPSSCTQDSAFAPSNQAQIPLFDLSPWMESTWRPVPATLEAVKRYFHGYRAFGKQIRCRRAHAVLKLKQNHGIDITVRTLARYIRWLREAGWMVTIERKARAAIRSVLQPLTECLPSPTFPSAFPSLGSGPLYQTRSETLASEPPEKPAQNLSEKIRAVLRRAAKRIARAKNPAAYRGSIIACEKRLEKQRSEELSVAPDPLRPPIPGPASPPAAPFRTVSDLFGHLAGLGIDVQGSGLKRIPS